MTGRTTLTARPVLCLVTSRDLVPVPRLPAFAGEAARAGVDLIQVRERGLPDGELLALVSAVVEATRGTDARVIVNERADIALAGGAGGVHLRGDSVAASRVRPLVPAGFLIGRSIHSVAEAIDAERDGACDYLFFGTVFPSASKPPGHPARGEADLRRVCEAVGLPVLGIGGVSTANLAGLRRSGAAGIAGIGLFAASSSLVETVAALRSGLTPDRRGF